MSQRKPPGVSWESFVERQIREGMERGEFDRLEGAGKPIAGLTEPRDDDWWIKGKLKREQVSFLPPTLAIRRDVELAREAIAAAVTENEARLLIAAINAKIIDVNSKATAGPPSTVMPLDVEPTVDRWRARAR